MLVCLQHGRCRHNIPRCRCENCWVEFTPCRHVVEVCRHHVPNTYLCEACLESQELSTLDPALLPPDVVDVTSTSTTNADTPPDDKHDDIDDIVEDVSEASTLIREDDISRHFPRRISHLLDSYAPSGTSMEKGPYTHSWIPTILTCIHTSRLRALPIRSTLLYKYTSCCRPEDTHYPRRRSFSLSFR